MRWLPSEQRLEEVLRRYQWAFLVLAVLALLQSMSVLSGSAHHKHFERAVSALRTDAEARYAQQSHSLARFAPLNDTDSLRVLRDRAAHWLRVLRAHRDAAVASVGDLQGRVAEAQRSVRLAWWETQQHHRLWHTRDRASSPLVRINIPISVTTRNTRWTSIKEMLLLTSFLPSLLDTMEAGYFYGVYLGYDVGDPLLDKSGAEYELRRLWTEACASKKLHVELKMFKYEDTAHHNVWAVNYITKEAYLDGYDYFFRVNDDSQFTVKGWTSRLVEALQRNEDFGAAGVLDDLNPRIWTHSFVGRPHIEIFGFHFPFSFGNYWSDDWITAAYTRRFSLWLYDIDIRHHKHAERYRVNWTDHEARLSVELDRAKVRWSAWLCRVKDLAEFCVDGKEKLEEHSHSHHHDQNEKSESKGDEKANHGISLEAYMRMENEAKEGERKRMSKFTKEKQ